MEPLDGMLELLHGKVRKLQRHRGKTQEAVRVRSTPFGQRFIVDLDDFRSDVAFRQVPERVDANRLDIDALFIHLAETAHADFADPRTTHLVGTWRSTHECQRLGNHAVRVHVDGLHAAPAYHDFPAARHRLRLCLRLLLRLQLHGIGDPTAGKNDAGFIIADSASNLHALLPGKMAYEHTASTIPLDDRELCPLREAATPSQYTGSLLLDSKIMELAMSFNPIFVILSS
jgi:hypothetical protein